MNKQFVPYSIALALKELGFNEECFGWYYLNNPDYIEYERCKLKDCTDIHIPAPLWQQVLDWLRTEHGINILIPPCNENHNIVYMYTLYEPDWTNVTDGIFYPFYEEAREAAMLEAIKIVKGERNESKNN